MIAGCLVLAEALRTQMLGLARDAKPDECCGLLVGDVVGGQMQVTRLVPAKNCHPEPQRFFTIDPAMQFALLREMRAIEQSGGIERLIGHYHSHPSGPAAPSDRDLAEVNDVALLWLIIDPDKGEFGAFLPRSDETGGAVGFDRLTLVAAAPEKP